MRQAWLAAFVLAACAALAPSPARAAKVYIDVDAPSFRRINAATPAIKHLGGPEDQALAQDVVGVLGRDLQGSGYFEVQPASSYMDDPRKGPLGASSIDFRKWSLISTEVLVVGGYQSKGDTVSLDLRLYDVAQGKEILRREYASSKSDVPTAVHRFANEVVYQMTGQRGIFETKIAYVSTQTGSKELWAMNFDGSSPRQLTKSGSVSVSPSWSPNGKILAFTSYRDAFPWIYTMEVDRLVQRPFINQKGLNIGARWAPKSNKLAVTLSKDGNSELYSVNADGGGLRRLTYNWGIDVSPAWSPDETRIVFVSDRSGSPHLYMMNATGEGEPKRLTYSGTFISSPAWSPKGDWIAFAARVPRMGFQIFLISPDGLQLRQLTSLTADNESPSWSPDGRFIAFNSNRSGGRQEVFSLEVESGAVRQLTSGPGEKTMPAWSPVAAEAF